MRFLSWQRWYRVTEETSRLRVLSGNCVSGIGVLRLDGRWDCSRMIEFYHLFLFSNLISKSRFPLKPGHPRKKLQTPVKLTVLTPHPTITVDHPSPLPMVTCRMLVSCQGSCFSLDRVLQLSRHQLFGIESYWRESYRPLSFLISNEKGNCVLLNRGMSYSVKVGIPYETDSPDPPPHPFLQDYKTILYKE